MSIIIKKSIKHITVESKYRLIDIDKQIKSIDILSFTTPKYIDLNFIPNSTKKLIFHYKFINKPNEIPKFIKEIEFYEYYYLLEDLPTSVENIIINKGFNNNVDNLGNNFKYIDFGNSFNNPVDNLPNSLEKIVLGQNFNKPINNLPDNLKILFLHNISYDHTTIMKLPKSIICLQIKINDDIELDINNINITNKNIKCYRESVFIDNIKHFYFY